MEMKVQTFGPLPKDTKVYIAAPFFTEDQLAIVAQVELCLQVNGIDYYSPRSEGTLKDMSREEQQASRKRIFDTNIARMDECTMMVACVEYKDTGTLFEIGYMFGKQKPVVLFSEKVETVNVMLAESAYTVCDNISKLVKSLEGRYHNPPQDLT